MKLRNRSMPEIVVEAISFPEFVALGLRAGADISSGARWSFDFNGSPVTAGTGTSCRIGVAPGLLEFGLADLLLVHPCGQLAVKPFMDAFSVYEPVAAAKADPALVEAPPGLAPGVAPEVFGGTIAEDPLSGEMALMPRGLGDLHADLLRRHGESGEALFKEAAEQIRATRKQLFAYEAQLDERPSLSEQVKAIQARIDDEDCLPIKCALWDELDEVRAELESRPTPRLEMAHAGKLPPVPASWHQRAAAIDPAYRTGSVQAIPWSVRIACMAEENRDLRNAIAIVRTASRPSAWWDRAVGGFYLSYESIPDSAIKRGGIEALHRALPDYERTFEHQVTNLVMRHIDRMNDVCAEDPAERIIGSFTEQFDTLFEPYMAAKFPERARLCERPGRGATQDREPA